MNRRLFLRAASLGPLAAVAAMASQKIAQSGVAQKVTPVLRAPWSTQGHIGRVVEAISGTIGSKMMHVEKMGTNGKWDLTGTVSNGVVFVNRVYVERWQGLKSVIERPSSRWPGASDFTWTKTLNPVSGVIGDYSSTLFTLRQGAAITMKVVGDKLTVFVDGVARWSAILSK